MRRYMAFVAVGVAALVLAWAGGKLTVSGSVAKADDGSGQAPGLTMRFAGGWLAEADLGGSSVEVLLLYAGDGSLAMNCTFQGNGLFNATGVGSWEVTGPQTVASTTLLFVQDVQGNLVMYEKIDNEMTLSDEGNRMEGASVIYLYWPGQDPLDPEEIPFATVPAPSVIARRIAVN
ncbi:MAG: hypothetical protein JXA90_01080 [Planctomycetes bacterium]|nr:hypothetical protein [Planctomycetota bacterium]